MVLSGLLEFAGILTGATARDVGLVPLGLATLVAGLVGYASIALLLRFLIAHPTRVFVGYRVTLGVGVLELASMGAIA